MMLVHLVRHGTAANRAGVLYGRSPGIRLSARGLEEVRALARGFASLAVDAVISSPLERTCETARAIAAACGLEVEVDASLLELDFGEWTGRAFAELRKRDDWRRWNEARATSRPPGGEDMQEVLVRARAGLDRVAGRYPSGQVVVVTHGDVIRALLVDLLGMSMDDIHRLEVAPASVSTVELHDRGCRVLGINRRTAART